MLARRLFLWRLCAFMLCLLSGRVRADQYALLIGVDAYQDVNRVNPLHAAAADAKGIAEALRVYAAFPADHVRVLASDGDTKPTRSNILFEISQLCRQAKPDDTVVFFFSGHGVQMDGGESFLMPFDVDGRTELNIRQSAIAARLLNEELGKINARTLILVFDMCRTDPFHTGKGDGRNNTLGNRQAKDFVVVPGKAQDVGPRATLTLYSCSPLQRSWEWLAKGRGYFSYFFEEGLRREAADSAGTVRVRNLLDYLTKAVPGAVSREEGQEQKPYYEIKGADALDLILASGRPPGNGGATAVPVVAESSVNALYAKQFQRGSELFEQKKYDEAYVRFEAASELNPQSAQATFYMGRARFFAGKLDEAEPIFHKALELAPKDVYVLINLGHVSAARKNYEEAEKWYRKAIELDAKVVYPVSGLGDISYYKQDYVEAEKWYRKAIELDPKYADPFNTLGNIYYAKKDYPEAEKWYRKAIELDPKTTYPVNALGNIYYQKKEYVEAERLYRKAIDIDPKYADPVNGLGNVFYDRKDYMEAELLYRKAIALAPKEGAYHCTLAMALFQQGQREEAKKAAQQAIDLGYKEAWVYKELGLKP